MKKLVDFAKAHVLKLTGFRVSFMITLGILIAYIFQVGLFERLELLTYDTRLKQRKKVDVGHEAVLAAIDEQSLKEIGRFPWPRNKMAQVIDKLEALGAKVIGLDMIWAERDSSSKILDEFVPYFSDPFLIRKAKEADRDVILADTLKKYENVVLGYFFDAESPQDPAEFKESLDMMAASRIPTLLVKQGSPKQSGIAYEGVVPNLKLFSQNSRFFGHFNMDNDIEDGKLRWYTLVARAGDEYYPSLGLQMAGVLMDATLGLEMDESGLAKVHLYKKGTLEPLHTIPVDPEGRMLINYVGKAESFDHMSIADIVADRVKREDVEGKAVIVGATATGLYDLRVTPLDEKFPGTEVHLNVISNILHNDYLKRPHWYRLMDMGVIVLAGLVLGNILVRLSAVWGFVILIPLLTAYYIAIVQVFIRQGYWISMAYPMGCMVIVFLGVTVYRYVSEEKEKKKIKGAFQSYLDPAVVSKVTENPDMLKLGGERLEMTVLFSDVRDFTSISEKLTPEALVHLLNVYLSPMTDILFKHSGTLDKYMGDAIMAFYGAPIHYPDHAAKACDTALEMLQKLRELQAQWEKEGLPKINIGIGLNTGPMSVGNMGSNTRFNYTVMGDAVNLGSRLEGTNKNYGTQIIISESTYAQVKDNYIYRELDFVRVKGKKEPIRIYELLSKKDGATHTFDFIGEFQKALGLYRAQQFEDAIKSFERVLKDRPEDKPSTIYIQRSQDLMKQPPPDPWDGVYVFTTK
ncbi:MAG: adenylate/guanylate cyclase domain-containing protein [Nitrospirae bacterium]|nr:adenylate/guanylate cyclase domain-containing protein [Nitrospirota bacterium]